MVRIRDLSLGSVSLASLHHLLLPGTAPAPKRLTLTVPTDLAKWFAVEEMFIRYCNSPAAAACVPAQARSDTNSLGMWSHVKS